MIDRMLEHKSMNDSERAGFLVLAGLLILTLQAGGCAGPHARESALRIGVIDAQRILNETKEGQEAKDTLSSFAKNRQALIDLEEKELKRMEESLIKQGSVLSANARKQREQKFRQRMVEYQRKVAELNREVQEKQRDVLEGFRERMEKGVARLAQELDLIVVLEKGRGSPTVYSDASLDITDRLIEEFNR